MWDTGAHTCLGRHLLCSQEGVPRSLVQRGPKVPINPLGGSLDELPVLLVLFLLLVQKKIPRVSFIGCE